MAVNIPLGYALGAWEFRFLGDPDPWYCTCGVSLVGNLDSTQGAVDAFYLAWENNILASQHNTLTLAGATLKIGEADAPRMAYSNIASSTGAESASILPQNCALLVDKLSNTGGRRGRGRFFVPGMLVEGGVDNVGQITTGNVAGYQAAFDAMYAELLDNDLTPVILHSDSEPDVQNPTVGGEPTPITSFRVQSVISTQRDRLR